MFHLSHCLESSDHFFLEKICHLFRIQNKHTKGVFLDFDMCKSGLFVNFILGINTKFNGIRVFIV